MRWYWLVGMWFLFLSSFEVRASEVLSPEFIDGMSYELNGRATMHAVTANMAARFKRGPKHVYWSSYHRLESFSQPRYKAFAKKFGIQLPGETWISIKSKALSGFPEFMVPGIFSDLRKRTVAYVDQLKALSEIGPVEERTFLDYMVRQEELQVKLMGVLLREDYLAGEELVAEFVARESAVDVSFD